MPTWLTKQVVPADLAVVADLHQVVDLGPRADARRLEGAAVDRRAGADLDVVADLDVAELRHLDVPAVLQPVAEAVGPEHRVGVDDDAVAEHGAVVEHDVGIEVHVVAEPAVAADDHAAVDPAASARTLPSPTTAKGNRLRPRQRGPSGERRPRVDAVDGGSARPCRWRTMATKAASGSATWIRVWPLTGMEAGTTTADARQSCR